MSIPVITISREYGSGGRAIGEKLAKELGIPFYNKELILMAAKESGLSEEYIKKAEQQKSWEEMSLEEHMELYLNQGIDRKEAMKLVAKDRGIAKRDVYRMLTEQKES